jgi:hypothetical protein
MLFVSRREAAARRQSSMIAATFPVLGPEVVDPVALRRLEPSLAADLWACRVATGFPVMPASSTYAYATLAEARGAEIRQGHEAILEFDGDAVIGVRVDGRSLPAGAVLVAAGPWTAALLDPTGRWAPIRPRWGVVVEAELAAPPRYVLEEAGIDAAIGIPRDADRQLEAPRDADRPLEAPRDDEVEFSLVPLPGASAVGSLPGTRAGPESVGGADPGRRDPVRARRRRGPDPVGQGLRQASERRWAAARRTGPRPAWPVCLCRTRTVGHLDRSGVRPPGGGADPRPGAGDPGRARPGPLRRARRSPRLNRASHD